MEFKDRIKMLRVDHDMTFAQLASIFDTKKSEAAVRAWELGRSKPDADTLIFLAKYFDCTADYLLGLSNVRSQNATLQSACAFTGLSESAINWLGRMKNAPAGEEYTLSSCLSELIESDNFEEILFNILNFKNAVIAKKIYDILWDKYFVKDGDLKEIRFKAGEKLNNKLRNDIQQIITQKKYGAKVLRNLRATQKLWQFGEQNELSELLIGFDGFDMTDLYSYRINNCLSLLIEEIEENTSRNFKGET